MVIIGEPIAGEFTTRNPDTGIKSYADSTPTGKLVVNKTDIVATVTIAQKETGVYSYAIAEAATEDLNRGDRVQVRIAATVAGKADNFDVLDDSADLSTDDLISLLRDAFAAGGVTVQSPFSDGELTLYQNRDYSSDTSRVFITNDGPTEWASGAVFTTLEFHATIGTTTAKYGTGAWIVQSGEGQEIALSFTREHVNAMAALWTSSSSSNAQSGGVATSAWQSSLVNAASFAVYAFDGSCNQELIMTGALTIVKTPFDSTGSVCPLS